MQLTSGLHINPNVRLLRPLGKGGMAAVWVAEHLTLRTEVAVKFIDPQLAKCDPVMLTRFKREASTAAQIKSPHVVQMLDHGVMANEVPYIVMELLEGDGLDQRLRRDGKMLPGDVATMLSQCAKALTKAHQLSIVHRDLKPANLFLIDSGYDLFVKVLDFGIAKANNIAGMSDVTSSLAIVGTPKYMSPEQLLSTKDVNFSTDLWALAVIAYHALTGSVPYAGDTLPALTLAVCSSRYQPISDVDPSLPKNLDQWFDKAFKQDPTHRFASANELASTFKLSLGGGPVVPLGSTTLMAPEEARVASGVQGAVPNPEPLHTVAPNGHASSQAHALPATVGTMQAPAGMAQAAALASAAGLPHTAATQTHTASGRSNLGLNLALAAMGSVAVAAIGLLLWSQVSDEGESLAPTAVTTASAVAPPSSIAAASASAEAVAAATKASSAISSATALAGAASATTSAQQTPPQPPRAIAPKPSYRPPATQPNCSGGRAFYRDKNGRKKVRAECL